MYGFSDHLNPIPFTGLSAVLQGSSRYSTLTYGIIEQTFVSSEPPGYTDRPSWTTRSRLVPAPRGSGPDAPLRAHRRRRSDPLERLLRRGRVRPRYRAPDPDHRAASRGEPPRARRAADHERPAALHRRDAARRHAH